MLHEHTVLNTKYTVPNRKCTIPNRKCTIPNTKYKGEKEGKEFPADRSAAGATLTYCPKYKIHHLKYKIQNTEYIIKIHKEEMGGKE